LWKTNRRIELNGAIFHLLPEEAIIFGFKTHLRRIMGSFNRNYYSWVWYHKEVQQLFFGFCCGITDVGDAINMTNQWKNPATKAK
jgi:hypothetical protein